MGAAELADLSAGVWGVAAVAACAEIGMVERLGEPIAAEALAAGAGVSPRLAERLLDVLRALGLVERRGERYVATRRARGALTGAAGRRRARRRSCRPRTCCAAPRRAS